MSVYVHKGGVASLAPWVPTARTSWHSSIECGNPLVLIYVHKSTLTNYLFIHIIASLKAYSLHFSIISYYITKSNDLINHINIAANAVCGKAGALFWDSNGFIKAKYFGARISWERSQGLVP